MFKHVKVTDQAHCCRKRLLPLGTGGGGGGGSAGIWCRNLPKRLGSERFSPKYRFVHLNIDYIPASLPCLLHWAWSPGGDIGPTAGWLRSGTAPAGTPHLLGSFGVLGWQGTRCDPWAHCVSCPACPTGRLWGPLPSAGLG